MRSVTYETVQGVGADAHVHLITVEPLGGNGVNPLDDFKYHIFRLGNAGETMRRLRPYSIRTINTASETSIPIELAVHEELSWPFPHIFAVGENSVTLAFSDRALAYTRETEISTVAANVAALLGASFCGPVTAE